MSVKLYNLNAEPKLQYSERQVSGLSTAQFPFWQDNVSSIKTIVDLCFDAALFL
jgi:hypothetical protein